MKQNPLESPAFDYKKAGVDIEAGDRLVDWIKTMGKGPRADQILGGVGGFSALFRLDLTNYKKPVLVSSTDGVGTKVKLASHFGDFSGVGQDLVGMCVNDLITCGAEPLFFLDYYATGKLDLTAAQEFLKSVRRACDESECALIGGETAEMPGVYQSGDFDCAGFVVGIVDEDRILGPNRVRAGQTVLGVASSGFHSNGYSLLRRVFETDLEEWKDVLLTPTRLYVKLAKKLTEKSWVHAMAHMTGGGIHNLPRVFPENTVLRVKHWEWPAPFQEVQRRTGMSKEKMLETLNCGVGFCVVVDSDAKSEAQNLVREFGFEVFDLGVIEKSNGEAHVLI